ncbi:MAG: TatD family hydrolase [Actinobacteria bacterium]|nr:TatD family hydrolase [Actinomycetota bacterium]
MIDSHAHLEMLVDPENKIRSAFQQGVKRILTVIEPTEDWKKAINLVENFDHILFSAGVHPHNAKLNEPQVEELLINLLEHKKAVAVGEIGLDYHYMNSDPQKQKEVFINQLRLAREFKKPVIVHTRDAFEDTIRILESEGYLNEMTLFHCFSLGPNEIEFLMKKGCYVSFAGNFTYPKADRIREALKKAKIDKIMFETDCPFLSPQPVRGKKNEPAFVAFNYREASRILNLHIEELVKKVEDNFQKFFRIFDRD